MPSEPQDRRKSLIRNGAFSALSWFLPLLLAFIVTPIVVRGLGDELYGLYAVILGFISYSFTFGIGKTAAKYVAEYRASGEPDKISESVSAALWFSLSIALLGTLVIATTARPIVVDVLNIAPELQGTAVTALYLASITILMTMLSQVFQCILQGVHRFDRYVLLTNVSGFLLNLGTAALVLSGYGIISLVAWNLFVTFAVGLMFYWSARRLLPEFTFRVRIRRDLWSAVLKYGGSIILYQIFGNLILIFERGWIVRKFGAESLTYYVVPMTLGLYLHAFVGSLVLVLFPVVNELLNDREKLVWIYQKSSKLVMALIAFALVSAVAGGQMFLAKWISPEFSERSYRLLVIHMCTFALLAGSTIVWQITESFRAAGLNALMTFLWFAISIPLMITLSETRQTEGVAIARLLGILVCLPMIVYVEKRFLGGIFAKFWLINLFRLALSALAVAAVEWAVFTNLQPSWMTLFLGFMSGAVVFLTALLVTGFVDSEERRGIGTLFFGR